MKQHQLIAVEKGEKDRANEAFAGAYHRLQQLQAMTGISRRYKPDDEDGEDRPPEDHRVQVKVADELTAIREGLTPYWDLAASKDETNTRAKANVVVNGRSILDDVSVPTLLWLEKQLVDMRTVMGKLPQLDPSREWTYDPNTGAYRSKEEKSISQKKIPRFQVMYDATDKHPAQIREYTDDVRVGEWTTTHYSGALPVDRIRTIQDRVATLLKAVQVAREEANSTTVVEKKIGDPIFDFLFEQ